MPYLKNVGSLSHEIAHLSHDHPESLQLLLQLSNGLLHVSKRLQLGALCKQGVHLALPLEQINIQGLGGKEIVRQNLLRCYVSLTTSVK